MKQKGKVAYTPEQKNRKSETTQRVFNLIILDESGSMTAIAKQAVSGLNETFQTIRNAQKEHQKQQYFISFVTFNSGWIRKVMDMQPVDVTKNMVWNDFRPDNCTPLFDAMGQSLNELKRYVEKEDVVLVTIITDDMENASQEYSGRDIKKLVADLKEKGWVFAYIGTNQDVDAVADDLGIRSRMRYEYSDEGTRGMFEEERRSRRVFFDRISIEGKGFLKDKAFDYFSPDDNDEGYNDLSNTNESEVRMNLWGKIKKLIKG